MRQYAKVLLVLMLVWDLYAESNSQESSFQLAPAPIPYPYFEPGVIDAKVDFSYLRLAFEQYNFNGMSIFGKARTAVTDSFALDGMAGLLYLSGTMPGAGPASLLPAYAANGSFLGYYVPIPAPTAAASIFNMAVATNMELQIVHTLYFNAILFTGLSLNVTSFTLKTLYNKYYPPTGTTYTGFTNTWDTTILLAGPQAGMQIDIPIGSVVRVSPFLVLSSLSGSGYFVEDPGTQASSSYSAEIDIPSSTTISLGFDIFVNEISIGAMAQQGKSNRNDGNSSYLQLSIGYAFSNRDKLEKNSKTNENPEVS